MTQIQNPNTDTQNGTVAVGVEELIERLRNDGVGSGRAEADKIIKKAQAEAQDLLDKAKTEAGQIVDQARTEAYNLKKAGLQALEVAARDSVLNLKNRLLQRAARVVKSKVGDELQRKEMMEKLILAVAGRAAQRTEGIGAIEIVLPERPVDVDEIAKDPTKLHAEGLGRFAYMVREDMLREGVTLTTSPHIKEGIKVRLTDEGIDLDLSDQAIADQLLLHLQPRFRALLEGIVR